MNQMNQVKVEMNKLDFTLPNSCAIVSLEIFLTPLYDSAKFFAKRIKDWNRKKERNLSGEWIYTLKNEVSGKEMFGVFRIEETESGIQINEGRVWYRGAEANDANLRGVWTASHAILQGTEFHFRFLVLSTDSATDKQGEGRYAGTMDLLIHGRPPTRMSGTYEDHDNRRGHHGLVHAARIENKNIRMRDQFLSLMRYDIYTSVQ